MLARAPQKRRRGRPCIAFLAGPMGLLTLLVIPVLPLRAQAPLDRFDTVVIDAGHGGEDAGARSPGGLSEKDLVLDVTQRLAKRLTKSGLNVVLTRSGDEFVPLEVRTAIANDAGGDLFISIHANSASNSRAHGIETYFVSLEASDDSAKQVAARENESFERVDTFVGQGQDPLVALLGDMIVTEHVRESSDFSKLVQAQLVETTGGGSRGVKQAPFVVLMGVQMPASLIEIGFLSNRGDVKSLSQKRHLNALVEGVARAVETFGKRYDARRGVGREDAALRSN